MTSAGDDRPPSRPPRAGDSRPAAPTDDDPLQETRLSGAQVYRGKLLDVRQDRVRLPDGGEALREYVVHPGAVLMIPELPDGRLVVERQFRYPPNRAFLEFPAGKLDPGETALMTARRELVEEAGYAAAEWTRLGVVHPVVSYSTEAIDLYLARGLTQVGSRLDAGEFLELLTCSEDELYDALDSGRLTDAKTIAALALYSRWRVAPARSCRVRITGIVQGVGYRDWMVAAAQDAGVDGWVRNGHDAAVEARIQGPRDACDRLLERCRRGPHAAQVDTIVVERSLPEADLAGFARHP
ncbi:MAG: acylphosphatase [Betaproteobacteria bacterium]|nr:acylphosphatase [Betaproteobacteria bacterium]MDE2003852.1 acylphosphatase [Betaproteobacteria bacterium]MDE2209491.1 acylphosphatase [Betaproteobacteria bacterium]MDE2357965.1 acylphosphatase [Betaproteobacteria bacterium]